ncbi:MAG: hypothetical protein ACYDBB_08605 [Armatimonadota bacterium]
MSYHATVSLTGHDEDGLIAAGVIDWGDTQSSNLSAAQLTQFNAGQTVDAAHDYAAPGSYNLTFTVTDDQGMTGSSMANVLTGNDAPLVSISLTANNAATGTVSVVPTVTDDGPTPLTITLHWGDGQTIENCVSGQTYTHTYAYVNPFVVEVTAFDGLGAMGVATVGAFATLTPVLDLISVVPTGRSLAITINYNTFGGWPDYVDLSATRAHAPFTNYYLGGPTLTGNGVETFTCNLPNEWEDSYTIALTARFTNYPAVPSGVLSDSENVTVPYPDSNTVTIDQLVQSYQNVAFLRFTATDHRASLNTLTVNWGDGQSETVPYGGTHELYHSYETQSTFTVTITATYTDGESAHSAQQTVTINVLPELSISANKPNWGRDIEIWYFLTNPDNDFISATITAQAAGGVLHQVATPTPGSTSLHARIPDEWQKTDYTLTLTAHYTNNGTMTATTTIAVDPSMSNWVSVWGDCYGLDATMHFSPSDVRTNLTGLRYRWLDTGTWTTATANTTEQTITRRLPASGPYTLEVEATYADGEVTQGANGLTAYNLSPWCSIMVVSVTRNP